ncbi:MAG TPA: ribosome-associated translation inhibitor RaiA [Desulfohalobiaceae bacterium]|nr:ribosome-associated translation inhibitor RaiA [Desulfohalobiaceae bacterium]
MYINFNFKNFEPSEHLKDYANNRFQKLDKYLKNSNSAQLQVILAVEKFRQIAEANLSSDEFYLSAQEETEDMYATIDAVLDKLEVQVKKMRDKQKDKRKKKAAKSSAQDTGPIPQNEFTDFEEDNIVKTDRYEPKPIPVEDAIIRLQQSEYGFLVFFNDETNRVNVVYRRKNGDYGLIDPRM